MRTGLRTLPIRCAGNKSVLGIFGLSISGEECRRQRSTFHCESFASMSFKVRSHRCSLVLSVGGSIFFSLLSLFLLLSRSNLWTYVYIYIYIRAWKNTTFRIHNGKSDTRDARKSLTERFHEGTGYRCAYQQARFLCPVATRQAPKILHISKLTKRERERERETHSNTCSFPRIFASTKDKDRSEGILTENRAIPPNECGFLTFSPVRRLFVSRTERDSPSRPSKTCLKAIERYGTLHSCPNTTGDRKKRKEERKKERKKIFDTYPCISSRPSLFFFLLLFNENVEPFPFERSNRFVTKTWGEGVWPDWNHFPQTECEHSRSHNSFLYTARLHRSPSPPPIGKPRYPVIYAFSIIEDIRFSSF